MQATAPFAARLGEALAGLRIERPASIESLRPLYDEAVEFQDPIQRLHGADAFIAMNHRIFRRMRELSFEVTSARGDEDDAVLEWVMRGAPKIGPRIRVEGTSVCQLHGGRVLRQRDYWDVSELVTSAIPGGGAIVRRALKWFA